MADHELGRGRVVTGLGIGFAAATLVIAPWLISGARLPLQNLWATSVLPEDMPLALLPVNQYYALRVAVLLVVGGAAAGLALRLISRVVKMPSWPAAVGVLVVHIVAIIQSFVVLADGLGIRDSRVDVRVLLYFGGMLGGAIVAALMAQAVFWLISRRAVAPASLGLALSAVPFVSWIVDAVVTLGGPPPLITSAPGWLSATIVGVVLGWCGIQPARRLGVWVASLAALWVTPAIFTSVFNVLGTRVLYGDLGEMRDVATQIFSLALGNGALPVLFALILGGIITAVRMVNTRRSENRIVAGTNVRRSTSP